MEVFGLEGLEMQRGEMKAELPDGGEDHAPEEGEHADGGGAEGAGGDLGAAVDGPSDEEAEEDGDDVANREPVEVIVERGKAVGDEGDERGDADEEGKRVFDKGDAGVDLDGPLAEFLLGEAAAAGSVGDSAEDFAIHSRDDGDGEDDEPDAGSEGDAGDACDEDEAEEGSKNVKGRRCRVAAAGRGAFEGIS